MHPTQLSPCTHCRERIPERIVHARGMTARGYFECTSSEIADLCSADLFSEVGKRTEVTTRFSTVVSALCYIQF